MPWPSRNPNDFKRAVDVRPGFGTAPCRLFGISRLEGMRRSRSVLSRARRKVQSCPGGEEGQ